MISHFLRCTACGKVHTTWLMSEPCFAPRGRLACAVCGSVNLEPATGGTDDDLSTVRLLLADDERRAIDADLASRNLDPQLFSCEFRRVPATYSDLVPATNSDRDPATHSDPVPATNSDRDPATLLVVTQFSGRG